MHKKAGVYVRIVASGLTHQGLQRETNEDNFLIATDLGLLAVTDGMGGHQAGEVASRMALDALRDHMACFMEDENAFPGCFALACPEESTPLGAGIRAANRMLHGAASSNSGLRGMGTTIVAVLIEGDRLSIAHVGDSRAYLVRGNAIIRITDDHSLVAEQVRMGLITRERALSSELCNVITRALGIRESVEVDLDEMTLMDGDRLLLCSDGLNTMVGDEVIRALVAGVDQPEEACAALIEEANRNGGKDNVTVVLAYLSQISNTSWIKGIFRRNGGR